MSHAYIVIAPDPCEIQRDLEREQEEYETYLEERWEAERDGRV